MKRFTDVTKEELTDLCKNQLLSPREIAKIYGVSHVSIRRWIKRHGIDAYYPDLINKEREKYFTKELYEFLIGSLLGDGCIEVNGSKKAGRFEVSHSIKQKEYLMWKKETLGDLVTCFREGVATIKEKTYGVCMFKSLSHPRFLYFRELFYIDGVKSIDERISEFLTPYAVAIWFQDDGSLHKSSKTLRISTDCFSYADHLKLQKMMNDKYGILLRIEKTYKKENQYCFGADRKNSKLLSKLIEPHVIESMKYKLINEKV